jgi:hypothetical protein
MSSGRLSKEEEEGLIDILVKEEALCGDVCNVEARTIVAACEHDPFLLQEFLGISDSKVTQILELARNRLITSIGSDDKDSETAFPSNLSDKEGDGTYDNDDDDDDVMIGPGECALCERYMKLTRHHLVPKSSWNRVERLILSGKSDDFLGHIEFASSKPTIREIRNELSFQTVDVCRPCHNQIHQIDNMELALHYNTIEKLLRVEMIYKFAKFANKQKVGQYKSSAQIVRMRRRKKKL